jgi:16S rRNA C1402 N4-methylase RsmH
LEHTKNDRPEFSRVVNLDNLGKDEIQLDYLATAEECAANPRARSARLRAARRTDAPAWNSTSKELSQ